MSTSNYENTYNPKKHKGVDNPTETQPEKFWNQQIAIPRQDTSMRKECISDGYPDTWSEILDSFEDYLWKQRDFANAEWCDLDHRFTRAKCIERCGELVGVDRYLQQEFDDLHTVVLTLNGDKHNMVGGWRCPLDHHDELLASNKKVCERIRYHLDGRNVRLTLLAGHKHGYTHVHHFLWTEGRPSREPFLRALNAHIENSPVAVAEHHPTDDPDHETISIEQANPDPRYDYSDNDIPVTRLVHEVNSQLAWPERDMLDAEPSEKRFAALLWAKHRVSDWRTTPKFCEIRDAAQSEYVEQHPDEFVDDGGSDDVDVSDFADAEDPTVTVEAGAWSDWIDPLE